MPGQDHAKAVYVYPSETPSRIIAYYSVWSLGRQPELKGGNKRVGLKNK